MKNRIESDQMITMRDIITEGTNFQEILKIEYIKYIIIINFFHKNSSLSKLLLKISTLFFPH